MQNVTINYSDRERVPVYFILLVSADRSLCAAEKPAASQISSCAPHAASHRFETRDTYKALFYSHEVSAAYQPLLRSFF